MIVDPDEIKVRDKDAIKADWREQSQLMLKELAEVRPIIDKLEKRIKENELYSFGAFLELTELEDHLLAIRSRQYEWDRLTVEIRKWRDEHR